MTGNRHQKRPPWRVAGLLLSLLLTYPLMAIGENSILIIKSNDNNFFNTTIESLIDRTRAQAKFTIRSLDSLQNIESYQPDEQLIITLGYQAAKFTTQLDTSAPIIHSYLTQFQHHSHQPRPNHSSVLLEQPLQRYALFIKHLLSIENIGILKTRDDEIVADELQKINQNLHLNITQSIFEKDDNPVIAVRRLLKKNDVLLTLPAPDIYNRQSLKGILLASYRLNKPVVSYSPSHVKSGALAAIYTSPENIGHQLADLVTKILNNKSFNLQPFYYASDFNIAINESVAESLGLTLAREQDIVKKLSEAEDR